MLLQYRLWLYKTTQNHFIWEVHKRKFEVSSFTCSKDTAPRLNELLLVLTDMPGLKDTHQKIFEIAA